MEKTYWLGRKRSAMAMARGAAGAAERLIHYELAGRYSIKAAHCPPYLLAGAPLPAAAAAQARPVLHLAAPGAAVRGPSGSREGR